MSDQDPIVALRETAECLLLTQREMASDVAEMATAVTEQAQTAERLSDALGVVDELKRAVEQLGEALPGLSVLPHLTGKLAELFDAHKELQSQVGRYITDASKQESGIRHVDERLKELERRLQLPGATHGQR